MIGEDRCRLPDGWSGSALGLDGDSAMNLYPRSTHGSPRRTIVPAMTNLHSHAFQRGFAGLAESRHSGQDDFWSWRRQMYRSLDQLDPDDMLAVATMLYVELVEAGYARVCEFHYVHNDPRGNPYDAPATMANAIIEAARVAGIGLTLLPVLYTSSGFGGRPPEVGQRRFVMEMDDYLGLAQDLDARSVAEGFQTGTALHSLRAVRAEEIDTVVAARPSGPIHIHVAEQMKEVEASLAWSGRRPVEWLLDHVALDERWTLVHATHMTDAEAGALVRSGATVALCPTTEGNLGDGFFNAAPFFEHGGRFGIGSDSNVCTDPREELRLLEYGRRLIARRRVLGVDARRPHAGAWAWLAAAAAGAAGAGVPTGSLGRDTRADFAVLEDDHPTLVEKDGDALLDALVFGGGGPMIRETWINGRQITVFGRHPERAAAEQNYRATMVKLRNTI